jgi:hypothetical protein
VAYTPSDLELAREHVRAGLLRIADLERSIDDSVAAGRPVELERKVLATMRETLALMVEHRDVIEASLMKRG